MQNNVASREYYMAVFSSKTQAIKTYYLLRKKGYNKFNLVSTPCKISQGCSYSLKFYNYNDLQFLKKELGDIKKLIESVYKLERVQDKKTYKKLNNPI